MRSYQIHELIYMRKIIIKINARGAPAHGHITVTGAHQQACANFLASFLFVDLLASVFYAGFFRQHSFSTHFIATAKKICSGILREFCARH